MELNYIISSQICFAAMWIFYRLFLHGNGAFSQNRAYLLLSLVVSMVIPLLSIPVYAAKTVMVASVMEPQEMVYGIVAGGMSLALRTLRSSFILSVFL